MAVLPSIVMTLSFLLGQAKAGADPSTWGDVLRHDVIPVASAYLVFLAMLVAYARAWPRRGHPEGPTIRRPAAWPDLVRHLAITAAGGYIVFVAIVVAFYLILGGESLEFTRQALVEGSLLAFAVVIPAFVALSWLDQVVSRQWQSNGEEAPQTGSPARPRV
jgi:hypothetical protein